MAILLWLILLFFCWPLALLALVLYPIVWLLLLPLRLVGLAVHVPLAILGALLLLPLAILRGPRHTHNYYYANAYPPPRYDPYTGRRNY
ncbi:MAG: hypothetical protein P4M01_14290 [Acidobacteriota bacterium]|nr:hypothetical protein [Acidobacteriota bacterium]